MSDLVRNPEDQFSHNEAHILNPVKDADRIVDDWSIQKEGGLEQWLGFKDYGPRGPWFETWLGSPFVVALSKSHLPPA